MAGYLKQDPFCDAEIVFVGNVKLQPFTESNKFPLPHATAELRIDVLASPAFLKVEFKEIALVLDIKSPGDVQFVNHSVRNNFRWGIPKGASWMEPATAEPTSRLRVRMPAGFLLSGPNNGLSHRIGVHGLPPGGALNINASATANRVTATTASCALMIQDLHVGDRIGGYMKGTVPP